MNFLTKTLSTYRCLINLHCELKVFINFVKKQQEMVKETVSEDGNLPRSSALSDAREIQQPSSVASDDEALIDVAEDQAGAGRWFNGLQVATKFPHLSNFKRFKAT